MLGLIEWKEQGDLNLNHENLKNPQLIDLEKKAIIRCLETKLSEKG